MTLCSLIDRYQHFGRTCYFLVSWRQIIYRVTEELAASFFRVNQHFGRTCYFLVSWRQIIYRVTEELAASFFRVKERLFSAKGGSWFLPGFGIKPICQTTCHVPVGSINLKHSTVFYLHLLLDSCLLVLLYVNTIHCKT